MKHVFNVGDRVQDSRNPSRKGTVTVSDVADTGGTEAYSIDYANDGYNGWSDNPYRIAWDEEPDYPYWQGSEYAEPEGWVELRDESADSGYAAQEGTDLADVLKPGTTVHLVRANKPIDDLAPGDSVYISSAILGERQQADAIDPDYYQFPGGAEVIDISRHLSGNGAQVVQYVSRSTRLDGKNKGDVLENLRKARWFLNDEIKRLEGQDD